MQCMHQCRLCCWQAVSRSCMQRTSNQCWYCHNNLILLSSRGPAHAVCHAAEGNLQSPAAWSCQPAEPAAMHSTTRQHTDMDPAPKVLIMMVQSMAVNETRSARARHEVTTTMATQEPSSRLLCMTHCCQALLPQQAVATPPSCSRMLPARHLPKALARSTWPSCQRKANHATFQLRRQHAHTGHTAVLPTMADCGITCLSTDVLRR